MKAKSLDITLNFGNVCCYYIVMFNGSGKTFVFSLNCLGLCLKCWTVIDYSFLLLIKL
ncbi:unnamed protein product [Brugia timori]|uniref:Rad50/SbcC-type AAA domain-containing protein n=1 Tax=Brugia timori TaxID=42155 RepID=A0A0R3QTH2_9BILA|nr:unnamed protein product [Brugia timori]